ncbi:hypothetical protein [Streptomyces phaeofaciens]|uniref:hypothetical protein n=1 Tax=Streptomyces phaeofaciens TaxID=68254 RepID=UPI003692EE5C
MTLGEAGVRAEAESALRALPARYADGDDTVRASVRRCGSCARRREAGVDIRPVLREVAEPACREDRLGMGSPRDVLLGTAG